MLLPLGKAVDWRCLLGRTVYVLGVHQRDSHIQPEWDHAGAIAKIGRHIFPHGVTLDITMPDGEEIYANTNLAGLRLLNPADRAPRPWWATLRNNVRNSA